MPTTTYTVSCLKNRQIARDIHEIRFESPPGFDFVPGQFALFQVPDKDDPRSFQPRAYSIASLPGENELLFAVRILPDGRAGRWFRNGLKEGSEAKMQGPMGNFVLDLKNPKPMILAGTGVGIAPLRSHVKWLLNNGEKRRIDLVWCTYDEETCFWTDEFRELEKAHGNFKFHLSLTEASPKWTGISLRIQKLIPTIADFSRRQIYICGNPAVTTDVKKLCMDEWGFAREDVHIEGYI